MSIDGIPNSTPIRMVVRISFADGSEYECEVRSPHAADAPMASFWPEGVVTPDVAKRMEYDQERQKEMDALRAALKKADIELAKVDQIRCARPDWQYPLGARGVEEIGLTSVQTHDR